MNSWQTSHIRKKKHKRKIPVYNTAFKQKHLNLETKTMEQLKQQNSRFIGGFLEHFSNFRKLEVDLYEVCSTS